MRLRTAAATVFASAVLLVGAAGAASAKDFVGSTPAERKASGAQPGDSCNGHTGFLVNPPPEEP
jgi:hypothetical protein